MSLMIIAALLLFIIPLAFGIMLFSRYKKLAIILLLIPFFVTLIIGGRWVYELNHHFVSSTDLANEEVDGLSLHDELDQTIKDEYGEFENLNHVYFKDTLSFDKLVIGTDLDDEIVYIRTKDPQIKLTNDIAVGHSLDDVVDTYGDRYYVYKDMGMDDSVVYIDRKAKYHLQFWYADDEIVQISLKVL